MSYDIVYRNFDIPAGNTVSGTATETAISSQATIKAGMMVPGRAFQLNADGFYSTGPISTTSLSVRVKLNGTTIATASFSSLALAQSSSNMAIRTKIRVFSRGTSGTIDVQGSTTLSTANLAPNQSSMANTSFVTLNTTVDQVLTITLQLGGLGVGAASATIRQMDLGVSQ